MDFLIFFSDLLGSQDFDYSLRSLGVKLVVFANYTLCFELLGSPEKKIDCAFVTHFTTISF